MNTAVYMWSRDYQLLKYNPVFGYGGGFKRDNVSTFAVEYQRQYRAVAGNREKEAVVKVNILNVFIHLFVYLFPVLAREQFLNNYNIYINTGLFLIFPPRKFSMSTAMQ